MYLYVGFFNKDEIAMKKKFISEPNVRFIESIFNNFLEINEIEIKGAIGYFLGRDNSEKPAFVMDIHGIKATKQNIIIHFTVKTELDINSGELGREIYKTTRIMKWFDKETGYSPLLLIVDKQIFNSIRKGSPNIKKGSSTMQEITELRSENDWTGICNFYEPLENIETNDELWNNAKPLYDLGFACSKKGEPQNGKERDRSHQEYIKKYRELSLKLYKRCFELESWNYRYASAVAYRYYQNVNELTKPKGRRDGNVKNEMDDAHIWFNKSLELYPNNIKDNYRKGKLIIDKQLKNIRYSGNELLREDFQRIDILKSDAINCLETVIRTYEKNLPEDRRNYFKNEYIKSLYTLGKFYCDEIEINWNEFLCSKIGNKDFNCEFYNLENLLESEKLMKKCFESVANVSLEDERDLEYLFKINKRAKIPPIDILNALGNIYFKMYYIKLVKKKYENMEGYRELSECFFKEALELRKKFYNKKIPFRNTSYVNDMLGKLYILEERYSESIAITRSCRQGYIKNTNAAALILTKDYDNINKARKVLEETYKDRYNLAKSFTSILLIKAYKLLENNKEASRLMDSVNESSNRSIKKLLELII